MKVFILTLFISTIAYQACAQGSIDIDDLGIQMGVASEEHVYIKSDGFSVQKSTNGEPLIYGDFNSNKVGIGTNTPSEKLHINGDMLVESSAGAELNLINTSAGSQWQVVSGFSGGFEIGYVNGGLIDGTSPFFIATDGKVGVGTTNPSKKLDVSGTMKASKLVSGGDVIVDDRQAIKTLNLYTSTSGTITTTLGNNSYPLYAHVTIYGTQINTKNEKVYWSGIVIADPGYNQINTITYHSSKLSVSASESGSSIILNVTDNSTYKYVVLKGMAVVWQ